MEELDEVRVYCASAIEDISTDTNSPPAKLISGPAHSAGHSPIELPGLVGTDTAWIGAAGHAWKRVRFSGSRGERTVLLESAGALEVSVALGGPGSPACILRIRSPLGMQEVFSEDEVGSDSQVLFDGLPLGPCFVTLEEQRPPNIASRLAIVKAEVLPGARVDVAISRSDAAGLGALRLVIKDGSGSSTPQFGSAWIRPLFMEGSTAAVEANREEFRRDATGNGWALTCGRIPPGDYEIVVKPQLITHLVSVAIGLQAIAEIELPALASVRLVLLNGQTGTEVQDGNIRIRPLSSESFRSWSELGYDFGDRCFRTQCVPGSYMLRAASPSFAGRTEVVTVRAGENAITWELVRSMSLTIQVEAREGEAEFPLEESVMERIRAKPISGSGHLVRVESQQVGGRSTTAAATLTLTVDQPGEYDIEVPQIPGYELVGSTRVKVEQAFEPTLILQFVPD